MATKVRLASGFTAWHCSDDEVKQTWEMFDKFDREVSSPNYAFRTTDRLELPYNQLNETFDKKSLLYTVTILANQKTVIVKAKIEKLHDKINLAVRNCFGI